jgi:hypothetical protein
MSSNSNSNASLFATVPVGTQWATYNVSVAMLTTREVEFSLAFLNMGRRLQELWFDSIRWTLAENSPLDLVPPISEVLPFLHNSNDSTTNETGIAFSLLPPISIPFHLPLSLFLKFGLVFPRMESACGSIRSRSNCYR